MGNSSGSPLQARLEINIFMFILIVLAIIAIVAIIYFISKSIQAYLNSPKYIEKRKNRPTSTADLNDIASSCKLVKEEKEVLAQLCKAHKVPNIQYLVKDSNELDSYMKELYTGYDETGDEESKNFLFGMRKKVFSVYNNQIVIKNSKLIDVDTIFTYTIKKGYHHKLVLRDNIPDGMLLTLPQSLTDAEELPKPLDKIELIFSLKDGTPYKLESRVIRFQVGKNDEKEVFIVHTDKISLLQKREQERAELNLPCKFNSVKVSVEKKGKKEDIEYIPAEKDYDGMLEDISTGGCKLITSLPIKAEQYIHITGPFNRKQTDKAIGTIVRTTKRADNVYILHIRFLKIDLAAVNRIHAMVSNYD